MGGHLEDDHHTPFRLPSSPTYITLSTWYFSCAFYSTQPNHILPLPEDERVNNLDCMRSCFHFVRGKKWCMHTPVVLSSSRTARSQCFLLIPWCLIINLSYHFSGIIVPLTSLYYYFAATRDLRPNFLAYFLYPTQSLDVSLWFLGSHRWPLSFLLLCFTATWYLLTPFEGHPEFLLMIITAYAHP